MLCDYVRAEDPTREAVEELEENAIVEHLSKLDGARVVVLTRCTIEAFLVSHRPDLVSRPSFHFSFLTLARIGRVAVEVACFWQPIPLFRSRFSVPHPEGTDIATQEQVVAGDWGRS